MFDWYLKVIKNYASFSGRARRSEFWYFTLVNLLVTVALQIPAAAINAASGGHGGPIAGLFTLVSAFYSLALLVPSLAVSVRRLHDTGRSGWWLLIALLPIVGALVLIVFYIFDSQPGSNRWGPNPKETSLAGSSSYTLDANA